MRVTVDIDETTVEELIKMTGEKRKSPAIARAVEEYVRRTHLKAFGNKIMEGEFDYPMTNEEWEKEFDTIIGDDSDGAR